MKFVFIDESIHTRGEFIISGLVISNKNPNDLIRKSLLRNDFNPDEDEFKSGINYRYLPKMADVRNDLKKIISNSCKFGLIIIPIKYRELIGLETLKGLKQFISINKIGEGIEVYIDQNYFINEAHGIAIAEELSFNNCSFHFEQDSKQVRGIQLADLMAHTCSIMLLETLGLIDKKVKAGENSGYDPEMEIDLGFELWATIRYNFLRQPRSESSETSDGTTLDVMPYGLYISEFCDKQLFESAKKRFGSVYLGCIH